MSIKLISTFALTTAILISSCGRRSDIDIGRDISVNVHPTAPDITVSVHQGVVTLSGMVKDSARWGATLEAAKSTAGVVKLIDKLHISTPKPAISR
jgi:osmotically-inducible protein OsmY